MIGDHKAAARGCGPGYTLFNTLKSNVRPCVFEALAKATQYANITTYWTRDPSKALYFGRTDYTAESGIGLIDLVGSKHMIACFGKNTAQ